MEDYVPQEYCLKWDLLVLSDDRMKGEGHDAARHLTNKR